MHQLVTTQGRHLLMAARIAVIDGQDNQRAARISVIQPARAAHDEADLANEIHDLINENFFSWVKGNLKASTNPSSANLRIYSGPQGPSFQVMAPASRALVDESGFASTAAEAAWIVRNKLRAHFASATTRQECGHTL